MFNHEILGRLLKRTNSLESLVRLRERPQTQRQEKDDGRKIKVHTLAMNVAYLVIS